MKIFKKISFISLLTLSTLLNAEYSEKVKLPNISFPIVVR